MEPSGIKRTNAQLETVQEKPGMLSVQNAYDGVYSFSTQRIPDRELGAATGRDKDKDVVVQAKERSRSL